MHLSYEDSGTTQRVGTGDHVTVALPERPTTGYRWRAEFDPLVLRQIDDQYEGDTRPVGAAGTRTFTFEVLRPAATTLRFVEGRAWESSATDEMAIHLSPA
jgi:inhibitor of cysteine peptidase